MTARSAHIASLVWTAVIGLAWSGMVATVWLALPYVFTFAAFVLAVGASFAAGRLSRYADNLAYDEELAAVRARQGGPA